MSLNSPKVLRMCFPAKPKNARPCLPNREYVANNNNQLDLQDGAVESTDGRKLGLDLQSIFSLMTSVPADLTDM